MLTAGKCCSGVGWQSATLRLQFRGRCKMREALAIRLANQHRMANPLRLGSRERTGYTGRMVVLVVRHDRKK